MIDTPQVVSGQSSVVHTTNAKPLYAHVTGSLVCIAGASPLMRAQLAALLRPFLIDARDEVTQRAADITIQLEPAEQGWRIYVNGAFLTLAFDSAYMIPHLEWLVISRAIERSTEYVAFHAASLAWMRR